MGSTTDKSICIHKGCQVSDVAFCQITVDTRFSIAFILSSSFRFTFRKLKFIPVSMPINIILLQNFSSKCQVYVHLQRRKLVLYPIIIFPVIVFEAVWSRQLRFKIADFAHPRVQFKDEETQTDIETSNSIAIFCPPINRTTLISMIPMQSIAQRPTITC